MTARDPILYKILAVVLLLAAAIGWLYFKSAPEKAGQVVIATPAAEVKAVPVVDVAIASGKVAVYQGGAPLKKKLTLPKAVVDNNKESVLASSKIPSGERAHTVTTVINTETGASETYVRTDPLPWIAYENRGEFGMYYGVKNNTQAIRLQARQDILQVKALHVGVIGSVDMTQGRPDYFVGVGVAYKW